MMELNRNLNDLIERTWDLHIRMNEIIHYDSVSFCKHCLEHGLCCGITETTVDERRRLIAIRDSLKDVQDMLVFLQTLDSSKQQHENAAFARLEGSRLLLIERISQYPGHGAKVDVLEELISWFAEEETPFTWKFKERSKNTNMVTAANNVFTCKFKERSKNTNMVTAANNVTSCYVINCIRSLFNSWNWYKTARIAIKLVVVSTVISSSIDLYRARQNSPESRRKILRPKDRKIDGKLEFLLKDDLATRIDVLNGRG